MRTPCTDTKRWSFPLRVRVSFITVQGKSQDIYTMKWKWAQFTDWNRFYTFVFLPAHNSWRKACVCMRALMWVCMCVWLMGIISATPETPACAPYGPKIQQCTNSPSLILSKASEYIFLWRESAPMPHNTNAILIVIQSIILQVVRGWLKSGAVSCCATGFNHLFDLFV